MRSIKSHYRDCLIELFYSFIHIFRVYYTHNSFTHITCFGAVVGDDVVVAVVAACDTLLSVCFLGLCGPPEPCCCWLGESEGSTRTIIAILIQF